MPNQTPPEVEERILRMTETMPAASYVRVSQALAKQVFEEMFASGDYEKATLSLNA